MGLDAIELIFRLEKELGVKIPKDEVAGAFFTAGTVHRYLVAKLHGKHQEVPDIMPLYQEVDVAVNRITGRWKLTRTLNLNKRFPPEVRAEKWNAMERALGISLPELEHSSRIPRECDSTVALTFWLVEHFPERVQWFPVGCERIGTMANRQWSEDEVWTVLCDGICDTLGVSPKDVTYDARMVEDLGMN